MQHTPNRYQSPPLVKFAVIKYPVSRNRVRGGEQIRTNASEQLLVLSNESLEVTMLQNKSQFASLPMGTSFCGQIYSRSPRLTQSEQWRIRLLLSELSGSQLFVFDGLNILLHLGNGSDFCESYHVNSAVVIVLILSCDLNKLLSVLYNWIDIFNPLPDRW